MSEARRIMRVMKPEQYIQDAERIVREDARRQLTPSAGECLPCYLDRQLSSFGCDGTHRFSVQFRDSAAPRSTALIRRLADMGGCCCDCEVLYNVYMRWSEVPAGLPPCEGVRAGSTQPCSRWIRVPRGGGPF